jgi:hypothetical protein
VGLIYQLPNDIWLVVEPYPSEKYEFVSWDDEIPNIWKNKIHVPKPPTRYCIMRGKTIINHPFGNGLHMFTPPIYGELLFQEQKIGVEKNRTYSDSHTIGTL